MEVCLGQSVAQRKEEFVLRGVSRKTKKCTIQGDGIRTETWK